MYVRDVQIQDAERLLAIYAPYVEQTAVTFEYDVPTVDEFRQRITDVSKRYPWLVAIHEGRIVGYAYASAFKERAAYQWAVETSIYVDMEQRGKGIGRLLYQALEEALKKQNILNMNACIAYTDKEDEFLTLDSVRFHEHQGYTKVAHFHKCGKKFDRWYDMIWMEKLIGVHIFLLLLLMIGKVSAQTTALARGADVSWCTEMEADGHKFYNKEGTEMEMMTLMKHICMTAIRLRVWVNPQKYGYGAWCDKADVVAKAKRAHAAGLDLMIDFHYSDTFCDPGKQNIPLDWADYSADQLKTAMADHTKGVLQALKDEGIEPKWVQVGNETNSGMLNPLGKIDWNKSGPARFTDYVSLSNAGYDAVKQVLPNAYVIIHLGGTENADWFFKDFRSAGGKFDMIGLSHYPTEAEWNSTASNATHSNVNAAKWTKEAAQKYGVPVMICETGFDVSKPALASTVMKDLFTRMKDIPECAGIFYWEPQVDGVWKPAWYNNVTWTDDNGNTHQGWGAYGMGAFTTTGRPTIALDAFSGMASDETGTYPSELKVYNKDGNVVLTTLPKTGESIYTGQLNATESWMNFHVVDEEHNIWYGTDPADKTSVSSADGHWNFWIDSDKTGVFDIEVNLFAMKWTHTYNAEAAASVNVVDECLEAPVPLFDLRGCRLNAPTKGLLLMKTGKSIRKVFY